MKKQMLNLIGSYKVEHMLHGKLIETLEGFNGITNEGLDALLDIMFHNDTQIATWYCSLILNTGTPALAAADTMASHAGWSEFADADVSETVRETWAEDAASSQSITNTTAIQYNFTASESIYGIFVCSDNVFGATDGTLWSTAAFDSVVNAVNGSILNITYTLGVTG